MDAEKQKRLEAAGWRVGSVVNFLEMDRYSMTVCWSDEDECFIARSPEWPGLSAFGPTRDEAIKEAGIALEAMIETAIDHKMEMPDPLTLSDRTLLIESKENT